jgi:prepilin-type N-terminal cleavage/methylation domain-containing protein
MNQQRHAPTSPGPASRILHPRAGFTLVELLVVIAIIGILAALIATAAAGALKRARQAQIKVELDQLSMAFETYKDTNGSYPPNCQVDDTNFDAATPEPTPAPINESQVLTDLKRHLRQAFPHQREPENLLRALVGDSATVGSGTGQALPGGMSAGEAIVFWLGGFSSDPKYPISGEGGPSYAPLVIKPGANPSEYRTLDPISNRKWIMPLAVARLGPRDDQGYFPAPATGPNASLGKRFIEFTDANGVLRRINFWQYIAPKSQQPYVYFDTSRHPAGIQLAVGGTVLGPFDPPAASDLAGDMVLHVHAVKKVSDSITPNGVPIQFATPDKFQILHAGIDGEWGEEVFELMSAHGVNGSTNPNDYLPFPTGPFTGEAADTIVNFSEATLEDSQP